MMKIDLTRLMGDEEVETSELRRIQEGLANCHLLAYLCCSYYCSEVMAMDILNRSRRTFLTTSIRNSCLVLSLPVILGACERAGNARRSLLGLQHLRADEAAEFEAIAARIIPSDDSPGAIEAGVIYFIDNVLDDTRQPALAILRSGLLELQASAVNAYGNGLFHQLDVTQQDALLSSIEDTEFFGTLRYLTIAGMFALPGHGGNRDAIGWELIGFEDRHVWSPPFGFYDADYAEKGA
jgi:gluconate 2-dehydrogenase gamma chain